MTLQQWLQGATEQLGSTGIPSARLDAELLLACATGMSREYIIAHDGEQLSDIVRTQVDGFLARRLKREPLAYIFGEKEFYGRSFTVTPHTLIPRPETEAIIELFERHSLNGRVIDVGTGSGCIGLTLKAENHDIALSLSDIDQSALDIARENAARLQLEVASFTQTSLLDAWKDEPAVFDVIVANLPYVDRSRDVSPETSFEPDLALYAGEKGLALIYNLIDQSHEVLAPHGYLLLEADSRQLASIIEYASHYTLIDKTDYVLLLQKIS